jgi:hypothetical protein
MAAASSGPDVRRAPAAGSVAFWLALALGAAVRAYLVLFTQGTFDVHIVALHGHSVNEFGLLEYYRRSELFNHPPFAGRLFAFLEAAARGTALPFAPLLRAPIALLDLGTALLLLRLLRDDPHRRLVCALYWLHPLAILFSSYHGNTDTAVAFFGLLATGAAAAGRGGLAGVALGLGLWIKLPVVVVAPALFFALATRRDRALFVGATIAVAVAAALPVLALDPLLLVERVVGYRGTGVETPRGIVVWGVWNALGLRGTPLAAMAEAHNTLVVWIPLLVLAWLRRGERDLHGLCLTVLGCFLLLYGLTSYWAFQYAAWFVPFLFFADWRFSLAATALLGGYVYGVYALYTGSFALVGRWDFVGHGPWPPVLDWLRDASVLLCTVSGAWMLGRAAVAEAMRDRAGARA